MVCFYFRMVYWFFGGGIIFDKGWVLGLFFFLVCGQCVGCCFEWSCQWVMCMMYEVLLYEENCFLMLIYDDDYLLGFGSLECDVFLLFMKCLCKCFEFCCIWFFMCGEYGEEMLRLYYYVCLFGFDFFDKVLFKEFQGFRLYMLEIFLVLWFYGFCFIGDVIFEFVVYVVWYVVKKIMGDVVVVYYECVYLEIGEVVNVEFEFCMMSWCLGLGVEWWCKYCFEVICVDSVLVCGFELKLLCFYDKFFEGEVFEEFEDLKWWCL